MATSQNYRTGFTQIPTESSSHQPSPLSAKLTATIAEVLWRDQGAPPLITVFARSDEGATTHQFLCSARCGVIYDSTDEPERDPNVPASAAYRRISLPLDASDGTRLGFVTISREGSDLTPDQYATLYALCDSLAMQMEIHRLRTERAVAAERQRLLDQIAEYLHQTLNLNDLIDRIFFEVNQTIHAEAQSLWLLDEDAGMIACRFATGPGAEQVTRVVIPSGEGIVGSTVMHQQSLLIADAQKDARHSRRAQEATGMVTHSLMSVPVVCNGRSIGAIQAINKQTGNGRFEPRDLAMLRSIADIAALCIENARLYADLEASYDTTLEALAAALDARDHETEGHSRRVVAYCARLGEAVGLPASEIRSLRRGALIHDLGKIGVPDAILRKPSPLSVEEWKIMAQHPEIGFSMLRGIGHLRGELDIVRSHHERWDGNGYPLGLKEEQVPLHARLFAIVDSYDAITSDRAYRPARSHEEAAASIAEAAGTQFDPALVAAFLQVPPADWQQIREEVVGKSPGLMPFYSDAPVGEGISLADRHLPSSWSVHPARHGIALASDVTSPFSQVTT